MNSQQQIQQEYEHCARTVLNAAIKPLYVYASKILGTQLMENKDAH